MKFTGFTTSLALAGFAYSAALPAFGDVESTVAGVKDTVVGGVVGPVVSTTGGLTGATKRTDFDGLKETVQTVPRIVDGGVAIASGAVGTVAGAGKRDHITSVGETVQAVPGVVNSGVNTAAGAVGTAKGVASGAVGTVAGAGKRDHITTVGETVQAVPGVVNSGVSTAADAVGTGESITSNAAYTANGAASKAGALGKRQFENFAGPIAGTAAAVTGSSVPAVVHKVGTTVDGTIKPRNFEASIDNIIAALTNNPHGFAISLAGLAHAVNVDEITQDQLSELPALQAVLALLHL